MPLRTFVLLLFVLGMSAQVGTSTLTGKVSDATHASIPQASVRITNEDAGSILDLTTNAEGIYHASALVPGTYRIQVSAPGFDPVIRKGVLIEVAQSAALDFVLSVGQRNEVVEITD